MKRRLYAHYPYAPEGFAEEIRNGGNTFTADEYTMVFERLFAHYFTDKDTLLRAALSSSIIGPMDITSIEITRQLLEPFGPQTILSFGSGHCTREHFLKLALPEGTRIFATDYNRFMVEKAKAFYPELNVSFFDMSSGDIAELVKSIGHVDVAAFYGSVYFLDDDRFVEIFKALKAAGVKTILDFNGGMMDAKDCFNHILSCIPFMPRQNNIIRRMLGLPPWKPKDIGKFQGWVRTRRETRRLYRRAGLSPFFESQCRGYKYISALR